MELTPGLMPGCDRDLVRPLEKRITARYDRIMTGTRVTGVEAREGGIRVSSDGPGAPGPTLYDRVLAAVGRVPKGGLINAAAAGVKVDERGYIPVDRQMRTGVPRIFAIGDIAGQPMLAHKATHEGKVAAEFAAGQKSAFDARVIPSVAYTDPEIAWVGVTETQAKAEGRKLGKGLFPWAASGRSLALNREEGFTELLFDPETHRVVGGGIVGTNAGDLISEVALAVELGADAGRPFSVCSAQGAFVDILYKVVGKGTAAMASWQPGQRVSCIGPFGNGFNIAKPPEHAYLVAGGIGIAPLLFLRDARAAQQRRFNCGFYGWENSCGYRSA